MIKAIILNLTGVLCDPTPFIWKSREAIFRTHGIKLAEKEIQEMLGKSLKEQLKIINKKHNTKIKYEIFSKETAIIAKELITGNLKATEGAKKLINQLKNKSIKIAIASQNIKNNINFYLKEIKIKPSEFDTITTVEELTKFKPNPQIFELTCKKLKVKPKECISIDDSIDGLKIAKKMGMKTIGFASNFQKKKELEKVADNVIDSLDKITL